MYPSYLNVLEDGSRKNVTGEYLPCQTLNHAETVADTVSICVHQRNIQRYVGGNGLFQVVLMNDLGHVDPHLIVCPLSVVETWVNVSHSTSVLVGALK